MTAIYIAHSSPAYHRMFASFGYDVVNNLPDADLVCFTGGEDVSPSFYGQPVHLTTYSSLGRDDTEKLLFDAAVRLKKKMVGICRGSQFLNVMNGGQMYQDVTNHTTPHLIHDVLHEEKYMVTSTHHQMMMPTEKAEIIGYADHPTQREWYEDDELKRDVVQFGFEIVLYRDTNCLCYQPHPEMDLRSPMRQRFKSLIENLLLA